MSTIWVRGGTPRSQAVAFLALGIVSSALSLATFHYQLRSLTIGGRDLGFFMATYRRLLTSPPWRDLAVQPNGNNAFGFTGLDGHPTLHHDIHLSPVKYVLAALYAGTGSWLAVQLALVTTVLLALFYVFARWQRVAAGNELTPYAITALALSPPFLRATCHDLRPSVALGAVGVVIAAALLSRAPSRHLAVFSVLGLLVREDVAVILALACAWLHLDGRRAEARRLYTMIAVYVLAFHALYLGALPFTYAPHAQTLLVWGALLLHPALSLLPARLKGALERSHGRHRATTILVLALPFVSVWLEPLLDGGAPVRGALSRSFPAMLLVGVAATYWLLTAGNVRALRWATTLLFVSIAPTLALSLAMISGLRAMAERREPVWSLAEQMPSATPVLTDFEHYQAFAGRNGVIVWERLPASVEPSESREFPASRPALVRLLSRLEGLVIVSGESFEHLSQILLREGLAPLEVCARESTFVIARAPASGTRCPPL